MCRDGVFRECRARIAYLRRKFRDGYRTFPDVISTGRECAANVGETLSGSAGLDALSSA